MLCHFINLQCRAWLILPEGDERVVLLRVVRMRVRVVGGGAR